MVCRYKNILTTDVIFTHNLIHLSPMGDAKKLPPEPYELNETTTKEIPERLRKTPGFVEVWTEWIDYRREERPKRGGRPIPVTARAAKMQLRQLECEDNPVAFIERAIGAQWEGLNIDVPLQKNGYHDKYKRTVQL